MQQIQRSGQRVEGRRDAQDVQREEVLGRDPGLAVEEDDGECKWDYPKGNSVTLEQVLECIQIIPEIAVHPCRDFESRGDQEPPDTSDAADQDVAGDKADEIAKLEPSHQVKNDACEHRAQRVGRDSRGNHSVGVLFSHDIGDGAGHVVEEWYDFDLASVSMAFGIESLGRLLCVLTNSEPTPPLNMLPVENVNCETIQLT